MTRAGWSPSREEPALARLPQRDEPNDQVLEHAVNAAGRKGPVQRIGRACTLDAATGDITAATGPIGANDVGHAGAGDLAHGTRVCFGLIIEGLTTPGKNTDLVPIDYGEEVMPEDLEFPIRTSKGVRTCQAC